MRSLANLYESGGDGKGFAELFAGNPHKGQWRLAEDHWRLTVREFLRRAKELEKLNPRQAMARAEDLAMGTLWTLATRGRCPWCR